MKDSFGVSVVEIVHVDRDCIDERRAQYIQFRGTADKTAFFTGCKSLGYT